MRISSIYIRLFIPRRRFYNLHNFIFSLSFEVDWIDFVLQKYSQVFLQFPLDK